MGKITLSEFEKRKLITEYQSELRQLLYQVDRITDQIQSLSKSLMDEQPAEMASVMDLAKSSVVNEPTEVIQKSSKSEPKAKTKTKSKRKTKGATKSKTKKKTSRGRGRPPKGSHTFIYTTQNGEKHELGEWDQLMIKGIHEAKQPLINSELLEVAMNSPLGKKVGEKESRLMISRTIHKLVNRKPILKKVDYEGRGNAYATEGMVNPKGEVKKDFKRK